MEIQTRWIWEWGWRERKRERREVYIVVFFSNFVLISKMYLYWVTSSCWEWYRNREGQSCRVLLYHRMWCQSVCHLEHIASPCVRHGGCLNNAWRKEEFRYTKKIGKKEGRKEERREGKKKVESHVKQKLNKFVLSI